MIITGDLDYDVLKQVIGPVNHSRLLTTGNILGRFWVSKHSFRKKQSDLQESQDHCLLHCVCLCSYVV